MKNNQVQPNKGMFKAIGNINAIEQRKAANETKRFSAVFLFGRLGSGYSYSGWMNHRVIVSGWFEIQQMENRLREIGCKVALLPTITGTYYSVS